MAMRPCKQPGCPNLVKAGYCDKHKHYEVSGFKQLDNNKTLETRAFYSSTRWTRTSLEHRRIEPLCRACKGKGIITAGEMVHHDPPLEYLLTNGLNPYDHRYLATLCNDCHLIELRNKRGK
jgi:5-methylcytosine-specific restriction protein A